MKLLEFSKLNPFLVKMTILITVFVSSFFFTEIKYFKELLKAIVFIVLFISLLIKVVKDILKKRGFSKNFDVFFSSVVVACIGKIDIAILTFIIYEFILFFNKNKFNKGEVAVKRNKKIQNIDISNVKIGDILILKRKQVVEVKCILQNKKAMFLSDEKEVVEKVYGDIIPIYYLCLENDVSVKVVQ